MPKKKFHWSYSALGTWESCPLQYRFAYLEEAPRQPNVYRDRGIEIHEKAEKFFKKGGRVPKELTKLAAYLKDLKRRGFVAEEKVTFDRQWRECAYEDRWGTVKVDAHLCVNNFIYVMDLKTGKEKDFSDQARIYLGGLVARYPLALGGQAEFAYSQTGRVIGGDPRGGKQLVQRRGIEGYQRELTARAKRMEADRRFEPRPGAACRWCDFSRSKGGPCDHG